MTRRLIESWLPIGALGEESVRERRSMTALPPTYYLHVWWARRPLVASRAAVLASLLPADADRAKFLHMIGIHGDPVATRKRIDRAKKTDEDLGPSPYGYERAFNWSPTSDERHWLMENLRRLEISDACVLDPTSGGGSIPFETLRLGLPALANDLNPVAVLVQRATVEFPMRFGQALQDEFLRISKRFLDAAEPRFRAIYPLEPEHAMVHGYLWARTIRCSHCDGLVPLSPNWRLSPDGTGLALLPQLGRGPGDATARVVRFEVVRKAKDQSPGTASGGDATCPFDDCRRVISGDDIKTQAKAGQMGDQLYCVVFKRRVVTGRTKAGKEKVKWERGYRAARTDDDVSEAVQAMLDEKLPEWEALDMVPTEDVPEGNKTGEPRQHGMTKWRDFFSPRQLVAHATCVEVFRSLVVEAGNSPSELDRAALIYLAIALDKFLNYCNRSCRWDSTTDRVRSVFDRHDFAFISSYGEMAPAVSGLGLDWALEQTAKCIRELVALARPPEAASDGPQRGLPFSPSAAWTPPPVTLTCKSGDSLDHIADGSIDAVVMDPPYYDNVMYAELSDFFYVWLKRSAGYVYPELFRRALTDKDHEAVANPAKFKGQGGAKALAGRDYQQRMAAIFSEMRRVLKPDGIMTLMFTHKATGAWDALTKGLIEAGFVITASWPINTEAEGSLHIKDKSAANSTIFLVCRPRPAVATGAETRYWEEEEPKVRRAVRERVAEYQKGGIRGVDLYLSCFGPALEAFSQAWPLKRGTPRQDVEQTRRRRRQSEMFEEPYDPYAVTPEDALEAARSEVKDWRLAQLARVQRNVALDAPTSWFVLAWDAFEASVFPFDEANKLAKVCGVDLDRDIVGHLAEKKGSDLVLWDSVTRAAKGTLGLPDGRDAMIDALHHAARLARNQGLGAAQEQLARHRLDTEQGFLAALEAVLEVLPVGKAFSGGLDLPEAAQGAGADFDALENLRRLSLAEAVREPEQLRLWQGEAAGQ